MRITRLKRRVPRQRDAVRVRYQSHHRIHRAGLGKAGRPRGDKLTGAGATFNWYCLPLDGKQAEAAWQFVRSMASPSTVQGFLAQGVSFPYMSSGQDAMWQDFPQLNKKMAIEAMPLLATAPLLPRDPEIEAAMKREINPAFAGQRTVREAMLAAKQVVTPLL